MPGASNFIGMFEGLESHDIAVHQHRCVRVRNRNATCRKCADACTSGCISLKGNDLTIAPRLCIGCGTCATVCPTCALEALRPNDAELFDRALAAMRAADGEAVLASERVLSLAEGAYDPERVVSVVNLGRIEETLIIRLASAGAKHVTLVQPCDVDAADAKGAETAQLVCDTANQLLEAWNSGCRACVSEKLPKAVRHAGEGKGAACAMAAKAADDAHGRPRREETAYRHLSVMADGTLPHFIPDRRERLLSALAELGEPNDVALDTRLWGHVAIDTEKCCGCRMCATFCPTGAIFKYVDNENGTTGIEHAPGDCVKCYCCRDICPEKALTLSGKVFAADLLSGAAERYEMGPEENRRSNRHSVLNSMKGLLGTDNIYE